MNPLDALYGVGAYAALVDALEAESVEAIRSPTETVRVNAEWADGGLLKIECSETNVRYLSLRVPPRGKRYSKLCDTLPGLFKRYGVKTFTANPRDAKSAAVLRRRGDWRGESKLVWKL